jgi:myosin-5
LIKVQIVWQETQAVLCILLCFVTFPSNVSCVIVYVLMQADMDEAKTKENAKLQSALEEMQLQLQAASKGAEQVSVVQEVSVVDREMINKLTAENKQLKVKVLKPLYAYVAPEYIQIDK